MITVKEYLEYQHNYELFEEHKNEIVEFNSQLVQRYPWLAIREWEDSEDDFFGTYKIPDNYDYVFTWFDYIPYGWAISFGLDMCEEIQKDLEEHNFVDGFSPAQIKEKWGCYDESTEVLTKNGWKYFKDVTKDDLFATIDPETKIVTYEKSTDIISYKYNGKMYHLHNRGVDLLVTPNHNLLVAKGSYYNHKKGNEKCKYPLELCTPDKYFGKDKRFIKGGVWNGIEPDNIFHLDGHKYTASMVSSKGKEYIRNYQCDDISIEIKSFLKFLGFYIAEGWADSSKGDIRVAFNPADETELIVMLLDGIGINYTLYPGHNQAALSSKTLALWLRENCGHLAYNKKVPNFVKELPPVYIELFLEYLYIGDGHKSKTSNILTTTSETLCNDVQELLMKCNYGSSYSIRQSKPFKNNRAKYERVVYGISWYKSNEIEVDNSKAKHSKSFIEQWEQYSGMVYCVTVPNHTLFIRRSGISSWCGNSLRFYTNGIPKDSKVLEIIDRYTEMSKKVCIHCGKPAKYLTAGWILPICEDCKNKTLEKYPNTMFEDIQGS